MQPGLNLRAMWHSDEWAGILQALSALAERIPETAMPVSASGCHYIRYQLVLKP
jgi:hypothetical protein